MKHVYPFILLGLCLLSGLIHAQDTAPTTVQENPAAPVESTPAPTASPDIAPTPEPEPVMTVPAEREPGTAQPEASAISPESEPAAYPTTKIVPKETKPKTPRVIPKTYGDTTGPVYIGHRSIIDRYAGWGWIRAEKDGWRKAKWVMLDEKTGNVKAPGRFLGHPDNDKDNQYRLYGQWAPFKGYEPNFDVLVSVFQIKGFELIGPGEIPKMSPPRSSRGRSNSDGPYQRRAGVSR